MAKIICGVNEIENSRYDGKTVAEIRAELAQILNIPAGAAVLLDGEEVGDDARPGAGGELEFVKSAGEKGC